MMVRNRRDKKIRKFTNKMQAKLLLVFCVIIIAFFSLIGRLIYLNQKDGERYEKKVLSQQTYVSSVIPYKRGEILDSKGTVLAKSVKVYNLILDPKNILEKVTYKEPTIAALVKCFGLSSEEINDILTKKPKSRYVIVKKELSYDQVQAFKTLEKKNNKNEDKNKIMGVWFEDDYIRTYPLGKVACDIIGFTSSGNVGNWGIEEYYSDELNGSNGREYGYFDSELKLERNVKNAVNGNTVVTSIDSNIQTIVEKNIARFETEIGSENAAVIVMNPNNGEIIAMASNPVYDLNDPRSLKGFYTEQEIAAMDEKQSLDALNAIWRNYCISDNYEPGSTFKPFTVAAALEEGVITNESTFECTGYKMISGKKIRCAKRAGHGHITLEEAVMYSCNVAMMDISAKLSKSYFNKYQNHFLFGTKTGVDLPGESAGALFSEENLVPLALATSSFGQNLTVNMIQMISGYSSLINGGNYYQPHVAKQILNESGATVKNIDGELVKETVSKKTSDLLREYMYQTVEKGTAVGAKVPGYQIGGKTGTAQKLPREDENYLVSFIGFAPVENPQMAIYVVIDQPDVEKQANSGIATKLAGEIMKEIFPFLEIYPSEDIVEPTTSPEATKAPDSAVTTEPTAIPEVTATPAAEDSEDDANADQEEDSDTGSFSDESVEDYQPKVTIEPKVTPEPETANTN